MGQCALGAACLSPAVHLRAAGMLHESSVPVTNSTEVMRGSKMTLERDSNTQTPPSWVHSWVTAFCPRRTSPPLQCLPGLRLVFFQNRTTTNQKELGSSGASVCHMAKADRVLSSDLLAALSLHGTHSSVGDHQLWWRLPALSVITSSLSDYHCAFTYKSVLSCSSSVHLSKHPSLSLL